MSTLTKAVTKPRGPGSPRATVVFGLLVVAPIGIVLIIAQLSLRFAISDLEIETPRQQKRLTDRTSRRNDLACRLEALKSPDRIREYAQEENMVPCSPDGWQPMTLSKKRLETWRECLPEMADTKICHTPREVAERVMEESGAETLGGLFEVLKTSVSNGKRPQL